MIPTEATLCFLVERALDKQISHIWLAMKMRGHGQGLWNGVGGKYNHEIDKDIDSALIREVHEEISVDLVQFEKVGHLFFTWPDNSKLNMNVHVYLSEEWKGKPSESEEMKPKRFAIEDIPYVKMWPSDEAWLPQVLNGKFVEADISFGSDGRVLGCDVREVQSHE